MHTEQTESEFCVPDDLLVFSEAVGSFDLQITDGGLRLVAKEAARKEAARKEAPRPKARPLPDLDVEAYPAPPSGNPVRLRTIFWGGVLAFGVPFTVVFVAGLGEAAVRWMTR